VLFRALRARILVPILDRLTSNERCEKIIRNDVPAIELLDIGDIIAAYGLPMDEMIGGISN